MAKQKIIQGEDALIKLRIQERLNECDIPDQKDLTGVTAIKACFTHKDGSTALEATLAGTEIAITDAIRGKIEITLDTTFTANLRDGDEEEFELVITFASETKKLKFLNSLMIEESNCN